MQSLAWGTTFHDTMFFLALDLGEHPSEQELKSTKDLILTLAKAVPCPKCQHDASMYFKSRPLAAKSSEQLLDELVTFHNHINMKIKKNGILTTKDALKLFFDRHYGTGLFLSSLDQKRMEDYKKFCHLQTELHNANVRIQVLEKKLGQSNASSDAEQKN